MSIIGLSITMAVSFLIFWYVGFETSFDKNQVNYDRIYRLSMEVAADGSDDQFATTGSQLGPEMVRNYPAIESYAAFKITDGNPAIKNKYKSFLGEKIFAVNNEVFKIFSYDLVEGSLSTSLSKPGSIVLTQSLARKLFGNKLCVDELVEIKEVAKFYYAEVLSVIKPQKDNHGQYLYVSSQLVY